MAWSLLASGRSEAVMTPSRMVAIVEEISQDVTVSDNVVEFSYESVPMVLVFDVEADRMRIMSPIMEIDDLEPGHLEAAMAANFHTTLDARYAVGNGVVWSAFLHPLSDLSDELLVSAVRQVAIARVTFGGEFTSGELVFGAGDEEPEVDGTVN